MWVMWAIWVAYLPGSWTGYILGDDRSYLTQCMLPSHTDLLIGRCMAPCEMDVMVVLPAGPVFAPRGSYSYWSTSDCPCLACYTCSELHAPGLNSVRWRSIYHMRKTVLLNRMALDILTATQGRVCALLCTGCSVYIPDNHKNVSTAL